MKFMITAKITRHPKHDPHNKKTGPCPINEDVICTDTTGEHHTFLFEAVSADEAIKHWRERGLHVTRVEGV